MKLGFLHYIGGISHPNGRTHQKIKVHNGIEHDMTGHKRLVPCM